MSDSTEAPPSPPIPDGPPRASNAPSRAARQNAAPASIEAPRVSAEDIEDRVHDLARLARRTPDVPVQVADHLDEAEAQFRLAREREEFEEERLGRSERRLRRTR